MGFFFTLRNVTLYLFFILFLVLTFCLHLVCLQYISLLMDWVESQINNEDIFPIDKGTAKSSDAIIT